LAVIVKADTQGSCEAICAALVELSSKSKKVRINVLHKATGGINESDVNLSETTGAVLIGFNVRAPRQLVEQAERVGVLIQYFSIIYELLDTVKSFMAGKLPPVTMEVVQGHAEVRNAISIPKIGLIAGSAVLDGKITRSSLLRVIRDQVVIHSGKLSSLRRFKDDVREVQNGFECGISVEGYNDVRIGDIIEAFMVEEKAAVLDV
jgi:translation initiation factor IF-2